MSQWNKVYVRKRKRSDNKEEEKEKGKELQKQSLWSPETPAKSMHGRFGEVYGRRMLKNPSFLVTSSNRVEPSVVSGHIEYQNPTLIPDSEVTFSLFENSNTGTCQQDSELVADCLREKPTDVLLLQVDSVRKEGVIVNVDDLVVVSEEKECQKMVIIPQGNEESTIDCSLNEDYKRCEQPNFGSELPNISTPEQKNPKRRQHQKAKRKIYRPKVLGEGRMRKKSETSNPKTPKSVKMKKSPKPKTPKPETPDLDSSKKVVETTPITPISEPIAKNPAPPCRRALDFNREHLETEDGQIGESRDNTRNRGLNWPTSSKKKRTVIRRCIEKKLVLGLKCYQTQVRLINFKKGKRSRRIRNRNFFAVYKISKSNRFSILPQKRADECLGTENLDNSGEFNVKSVGECCDGSSGLCPEFYTDGRSAELPSASADNVGGNLTVRNVEMGSYPKCEFQNEGRSMAKDDTSFKRGDNNESRIDMGQCPTMYGCTHWSYNPSLQECDLFPVSHTQESTAMFAENAEATITEIRSSPANPEFHIVDNELILSKEVLCLATKITSPLEEGIEIQKQIITYLKDSGRPRHSQEEKAIVLRTNQGIVIPFRNSFYPPKKRNPKDKVDLNPRTYRVLQLLITNELCFGESDAEKETEKWWEYERDLFQARVHSFISRMHGILGDRSFSPWKGSVVDSIVGVFLTQNVSDYLSSSAFMSLAAKFPLKSATCQELTGSNTEYVVVKDNYNMLIEDANSIHKCPDTCVIQTNDGNQSFSSFSLCMSSITEPPSQSSVSPTNIEADCSKISDDYMTENIATTANKPRESKTQGIQEAIDMARLFEKCSISPKCSFDEENEMRKSSDICNSHKGGKENDIQSDSMLLNCLENLDDCGMGSEESKTQAPPNNDANKMEWKEWEEKQRDLKEQQMSPEIVVDDDKKVKMDGENKVKEVKKKEIDWDALKQKWDPLRKMYSNGERRRKDHMDSVDWEGVRCAVLSEITSTIKERGQQNILGERIKDFLDRVYRIHDSIDLEWLRHAPSSYVKEFLFEVEGLGLKSVECIRLLSLQHTSFPVDTNVARIAVRLGWVPLAPLPEEVQIHLLELYPMMDSIQKYLWPRLCTLDQPTLYELHYQLITFGKVFCTKKQPNCKSCPMRDGCRHFTSACASSKLALPGPADKSIVTNTSSISNTAIHSQGPITNPTVMPLAVSNYSNPFLGSGYWTNNSEPIIEEPKSPELEIPQSPERDIEDFFKDDPEYIPTIVLNDEHWMDTLKNNRDNDNPLSRALVPLPARASSFPLPKLKRVERLRTEHRVYELPDTHPLLSEHEIREADDPCPYLLAIWKSDETINSFGPPTKCNCQLSGQLCSCGTTRKEDEGIVYGTILIPCRTAMRGSFPLNGTYFQVNEVFADDESSHKPIVVPRDWLWNLPRRTAYCGASTTAIFRGLSEEETQLCFWQGFICIRGFDRRTRYPKRLAQWLHHPTAKKAKADTKSEGRF